ncbi:MAG: hypothetical protein WCO78_03375 [Candidatus Roizmanbacteria bacterium]
MPNYLQRYVDCIKRNPFYTILLVIVAALSLIVIVPSGSEYCISNQCGLYFWGAHEHDGIWHIALIESAFKSWPFILPVFSGALLTGYNFLFDFIISLFTRVGFSGLFIYFKVQPILWFICFSLVVYQLGNTLYKLNNNDASHRSGHSLQVLQIIILFSLTILGSFGPIYMLAREGVVWGNSGIFAMQGPVGMTNPQLMWSFVVIVMLINRCLILLHRHSSHWIDMFVIFVLVSLGFALKAYSVPAIIWIITSTAVVLVVQKKWGQSFQLSSSAGLSILLIYLTQYAGSTGGGFAWDPFALVRSMYSDHRVFQNDQVMLEWFQLQKTAPYSLRLWRYYLGAAGIYTISTLGMRICGLGLVVQIIHKIIAKSKIDTITMLGGLAMIGALLSCIPALFLIQKGVWWNTVQFYYFSEFLAGIGFALWMWKIYMDHKKTFVFFAGITVFLSVCFLMDSLSSFFQPQTASRIAKTELVILASLKQMPNGLVYVPPYVDENRKNGNESERTLPDMIDTAYVSALSGKQVYYADETQLDLLNIPFRQRQSDLRGYHCESFISSRYAYIRTKELRYKDIVTCLSAVGFFKSTSNRDAELWINQNDIYKTAGDTQKQ